MPSSPVAHAILKFLETQAKPVSVPELTNALHGFNTWDIREAIWELTAASQAEITWDWKLQFKPAATESRELVPA